MNIYQHVENFKKDLQNRYLFWAEQLPTAYMSGQLLSGINSFLCGTNPKNKECKYWITSEEANHLNLDINNKNYQAVLSDFHSLSLERNDIVTIGIFKLHNLVDTNFFIKYGEHKNKKIISSKEFEEKLRLFVDFKKTDAGSYYRVSQNTILLNFEDINSVLDTIVDWAWTLLNPPKIQESQKKIIKNITKNKLAHYFYIEKNNIERISLDIIDDFLMYLDKSEDQLKEILRIFYLAELLINNFLYEKR